MWIYREPKNPSDLYEVGYYKMEAASYGAYSYDVFQVVERYSNRDRARDAVRYLNGGV
jgi:hypothetical protein